MSDFFEAMKTPLQKYINQNHSNILGISGINPDNVIKDIQKRVQDYQDQDNSRILRWPK